MDRLGVVPHRLGGLGREREPERADLRLEYPRVERLAPPGARLPRVHSLPLFPPDSCVAAFCGPAFPLVRDFYQTGGHRHDVPSLSAVSAGERAGKILTDGWSGAGSNRRPSAFQAFLWGSSPE